MAKTIHTQLDIEGQKIPVRMLAERRKGCRVSLGKNGVIFRYPASINQTELEKQWNWMADWVRQKMVEKPQLSAQFIPKIYEDGQTLVVGNRQYTLQIEHENMAAHHARLVNGAICLRLNPNDSPLHLQKAIRTLLSRIVAQDFLPEITRRVAELNFLYFKKNVKSVSLKYNHSNWGSCSARTNLNFSTRLLFAPDEVIDYLIIHELAHLVEMNHSDRFWQVVAAAMPDYAEKEKWLKKNGRLCDF